MNFKRITGRFSSLYPVLAYNPENSLFYLSGSGGAALGIGVIARPLSGGDETIARRLTVLLNQDFPKNTVLQFSLLASPSVEGLLREQEITLLGLKNDDVLSGVIRSRLNFLRESVNKPPKGISSRVRNFVLMVTLTLPCSGKLPDDDEIHHAEVLSESLLQILKTAEINGRLMTNDDLLSELCPFFNGHDNASWKNGRIKADDSVPLNEQLMDYDSELRVSKDFLEIGGYTVNTYSVKRYPEYVYFGNATAYACDVFTGTNGARPLKFNLTVTSFCRNEEEALATGSALRSYYKENGFELMPDRYYILPIFLNALPFGTDTDSFNSLMRFRTLCSTHILPLLPIFADSAGTGTGVINLISRSGQLMNLSLYDSGTNYNLCIAAQSGSGKSFLVNEILVSYLAKGATCYVIDVGRSYEKLCSFLGGTFLSFGINSDVSLNPFECIRDYADEADMINGLLSIMAAPTERLSDFQTAELKRITGSLFRIHGNALSVDIIAEELGSHEDQRIRDLGRQLYSFTSGGEYGRFFSGHNNMKLGNSLTVLELEELKGRRHLQQVVLLQLIYQIQQNMYLGERNRPKIIIIDEAWDLLRDGDVAGFIETGYRRFRKYGGAAVTVTQSVNDLYGSEAGVAIAENSANMYLLGQKAETVNLLEQEKRLPLTSGEYEYLRSVHTMSGMYSEIFVISDRGNCVGRLAVDPFRKLLYSTRAEEVNAIEKLLKKGMNVTEAINTLLSQDS